MFDCLLVGVLGFVFSCTVCGGGSMTLLLNINERKLAFNILSFG